MPRYGASPQEWAWAKRLAKADLLPVVSNPRAVISPRSKMKEKGKTPSLYIDVTEGRVVIGFTGWTDHVATTRDIERWAGEADNGICIQTRHVRAFDCDVPDRKLSDRIVRRFIEALGVDDLPTRSREGTGKQLVAFRLEGEFRKRSFIVKEWQEWDEGKGKDVTKRWIVEFLAEGQQFIAAGTHPSGARYEWDGGLPDDFPKMSARAFERAWQAVVDEFALEGADRRSERRDPTLIEDLDVEDPVAEHVIESDWPTYGIHKGMLYLDCPNKEGHSSDNGESETAWMLAGTGKYRNGHFKCMHTGCAGITDPQFLKAVGYRPAKAEDFEDLSQDDSVVDAYLRLAPGASAKSKELKAERRGTSGPPLPGFNRDERGRIETSLENIARALEAPQACGCEIAFDAFRGELMLAERGGKWRAFTDADAVELRIRLEALGFKDKIGREMMRDALELVGDRRKFDSARLWLTEEVPAWDRVRRIERFWPDYMGTEDTPYTRALGLYSWTAQAGRIMEPGAKVDMVPVLVAPEGFRKSTAVALIAPNPAFFAEFNLQQDDKELARLMRGCLVGELAELRGISARDGEAVLAWITRREEKFVPKFKEFAVSVARRVVFYGTTNFEDFLQPHMGKRRWLPVTILRKIDTDLIERDRLQFWAEALERWHSEGIEWQAVEELAKAERDAYREVDIWAAKIEAWLDEEGLDGVTPRDSGTLTTAEVLIHCIGLDARTIRRPDQIKVAHCLREAGLEQVVTKLSGGRRSVRVWRGKV